MLAAVLPVQPQVESDSSASRLVASLSAGLGVLIVAALASWLAYNAPGLRAEAGSSAGGLRPPSLSSCMLLEDGFLRGKLYGALQREIDWQGRALQCDGMLRPDGAGMRLLFAASDPQQALLFILGIDAAPDQALGREVPINLTIVDEQQDRFYNSGIGERCWTTLSRIQVLGSAGQREYNVVGEFYCAGALAAVSGPGAVTPAEFSFSGRLSINDE